MAEKRVSVRLGATGGNQVRGELRGVGEAGKQGMSTVDRETERANRRLAQFAKAAGAAAAAVAGAFVAAGGAMIRSGLQTIDAQAKLAASLQTTVQSVQVLSRAGDLAGVSLGEIEQATAQLTRRLSEVASGGGTQAARALDRLRLSGAQLQALPLDERLAAIQQALEENVPAAERAAVAADLFGQRAALAFTRIDTATLRQAAADIEDFGVGVSQLDAAQVERTNDAISRLGLVWTGLSNQLTVAAAPALEGVADALAAVARGLPAVIDGLQGVALGAAVLASTRLPALVAGLATATTGLRLLSGAATAARVALALLGGPLGIAVGLATAAAGAFVLMRDRGDDLDMTLYALRDSEAALNTAIRENVEAAPAAAQKVIERATALREQALAARDAARSELALVRARMERANDPFMFPDRVQDAVISAREAHLARAEQALAEANAAADRALRSVTGSVSEQMTEAVESVLRLEVGTDAVTEAVKRAGATVKVEVPEMREQFDALAPAVEAGASEMERGVERAMDAAGDAIARFAATGKADVKSLVSSVIADFARIQIRQSITGPLSAALSAAVGGALGGGGGGFSDGGFSARGLYHSGGLVGAPAATRVVPDAIFAGARRMHRGGMAGFLAPDEVPAILQRGERVLSRSQVARGEGASVLRVELSSDLRAEMLETQGAVAVDVVEGRLGRFARGPEFAASMQRARSRRAA